LRGLEARGRSREEFVDLISRQNILDDEKVAECFEKGKTGISGNLGAGGSVKGHGFAPRVNRQSPRIAVAGVMSPCRGERCVNGRCTDPRRMGIWALSELSVVDHHFDQFGDLVPREVTRI
jgi:hypothetical protein